MQPRAYLLLPPEQTTFRDPMAPSYREKRESGRIATEVFAVCLLRQTSDDDLARGWDDGARPRQVMTKPMS